ncbi:hypothetical protein ACYE2N_14940 [Flavobacterium sp. MAHUQ-51]|uniref:hypothetical protein n=1 Tax=Flavobacterium sp. GCM10022190 TaxID=3252639 RepID=UPI003612C057
MGKLSSFIKLEGTLNDLTFYKSQGDYLVRTKGGVSKKRIMTDPAFARTRENISEFSSNAQAGKLVRDSVGILLNRAKDSKLSSRMLQLMNEIKDLDSSSKRGKRKVAVGLQTAAGKALLKGFDFNSKAKLASVLHAPYSLNSGTGVINIDNFVSAQQLLYPEGATHVSLRSGIVKVDFTTDKFENSYSPESIVALDNTTTTVVLTPANVPSGSGIQFNLLLIEFYQEVNGTQYPLRSGNYNVLNLVDVI